MARFKCQDFISVAGGKVGHTAAVDMGYLVRAEALT